MNQRMANTNSPESTLTAFVDNVKKLAGSCFYQLQKFRTARRSQTTLMLQRH